MNGLQQAFQKYFSSSTDDVAWVRNPYCVSEKPDCTSVQNYKCLIEITSDTSLKQKFSKLPLVEFWCSLLQEYLQVSNCAVLKLLPFPTTYLCKSPTDGDAVGFASVCLLLYFPHVHWGLCQQTQSAFHYRRVSPPTVP